MVDEQVITKTNRCFVCHCSQSQSRLLPVCRRFLWIPSHDYTKWCVGQGVPRTIYTFTFNCDELRRAMMQLKWFVNLWQNFLIFSGTYIAIKSSHMQYIYNEQFDNHYIVRVDGCEGRALLQDAGYLIPTPVTRWHTVSGCRQFRTLISPKVTKPRWSIGPIDGG